MEASCVRHTEIPGTTKLFSDLLYHFDRVSKFYPSSPFDLQGYLSAAQSVEYPAARRVAMVEALRELNGPHELLDDFSRPDTIAVVTGQQVGLYGGPCYTIFKALTAVSIARQLTAAGRRAVPVFWIATEDHDFAEVDHTWTFDGGMRPQKLVARGVVRSQQPVGGVKIDAVPRAELHAALSAFPFGEKIAALVDRAYCPGNTFGGAFRNLISEILGDHAVLFLDPMSPAVRHIAAPFLVDSAKQAKTLSKRVMERNKELNDAGYHAQVHFEGKEASLFFRLDGDKRVSLKNQDPAQLADRPELLSPNALLRPVMQDYLLPTTVMVGGPAELAYMAQSAVLYEELLGRQPVAVPRAAFTLLDSHAAKAMDRYGLRFQDVLHPEEAFREKLAERLAPPAIRTAFKTAGAQAGEAIATLHSQLQSFDPTLAAALAKSKAKIQYQLAKTERKVAREIMRRDERSARDAEYLTHLIYPEKHLQERLYSILPFLAQYGPDVIEHVYENIHLNCPDHLVLPL